MTPCMKAEAVRKINNIVKVHQHLEKMPIDKDAKAILLAFFIKGISRSETKRSRAWGNPELMGRR